MSGAALVEASGLEKRFSKRAGFRRIETVRAVDGVSVSIGRREVVAVVGESGSGKSTLGRLLVRLLEPDAGSVRFDGVDLSAVSGRRLRALRRRFQFVFQDAQAALNPRMTARTLVREPLDIHRIGSGREERDARVDALLEQVGIDPAHADRYPHAFSGGQRQRIGIARAIATEPDLLVADEPVSALDAPVQAQIVNLLLELQERLGLSMVFIAHDLRLVERIADRVVVMYLGRIVEEGRASDVYARPRHPYTRALLASVPQLRPGSVTEAAVEGEAPSAVAVPGGCRFHPRCSIAIERCRVDDPGLEGDRHRVACWVEAPPASAR